MDIYVAGKWEEKERVQEVQDLLKCHGHTIVHDWTRVKGDTPGGSIECAKGDLAGVLKADAFVGVFEKDLPYKGSYVELGIALARGIPIYILGTKAEGCVFLRLPEVKRGLEGLIGECSDAVSN